MKKQIKKSLLYLSLFSTVATFNSCTTEPIENSNSTSEIDEVLTTVTNSNLTQINVNGTILTVEEMENGDYAFGDMIFPKVLFSDNDSTEVQSAKSLSVGRIGSRWPDNAVPYFIDGYSDYKIEAAIRNMELFTNLRFYETTITENPYALGFYDFSGCNASVGYVDVSSHSNSISTGSCSSTSSVMHEIGHVLGLWHEQCRSDRNDYIQVNFDNTNDDYQFQIYGGGSDGSEYTEFDFNSIMLYDSYSTSSNGRPVMTKLDGSTFDSNTLPYLSDLDVEGLKEMYPITDAKLYSIMGGNGLYVSSENGRRAITCNRSAVGSWEKFVVIPMGSGKVILQDNKNKKYLTFSEEDDSFTFSGTSLENAISLIVSESTYGQSEAFQSQWYYTLRPEDNSLAQNLSVDEDNNGTLTTGRGYEFRITLIN